MTRIRRLVLDVLKPHQPSIIDFAQGINESDGVKGVNATVVEIDEEVQNIKITIEGDDIDYDHVKQFISDSGGSVHSIDEIICGERMVEESETPQD